MDCHANQGGVLSTNFYQQFNNPLQLESAGAGAMLCTIRIAAPAVADDISLAANNKCDLQLACIVVKLDMI